MKKLGFTLSEVLLTLSIIGVVSAMTVPSLMTSIEDRELQAQAKKAYNTLQSAISMKYALTRQTPADTGIWSLFASFLTVETPVLKYNDKNANRLSLPDGQVMISGDVNYVCYDYVDLCFIMVDVNGADGPNFSGVKNSTTTMGTPIKQIEYVAPPTTKTAYDRKTRDYVYFQVKGMNITPYLNHGATRRYFTGEQ